MQVAVINTRESNIRDISENETYLDDAFDVLREQYQFPVDQSAAYYLSGTGFRVFSMLTLAFLQMGILELALRVSC